MSICWGSEPMPRRAGWIATTLALVIAASAALAPRAQARHATQIQINDQGIRVDDGERGDSVIAGGKVEVTPGRHGIHITVDDDHSGLVRIFSDAVVPAGKHVAGDVVAVFGNVDVSGEVSGDVVAVLGTVRLHQGANVDGDVTAVGGGLHQEEGVTVSGETVSLGFLPRALMMPTLPLVLGCLFAGWVIALIVGWLFTLLFPSRLVRVAVTCSRRTAASFGLGVVSLPLMCVAEFVLLVTVIGLPIAVVLPFAYALLVFAGQLAASYVLGCKLLRRRIGEGSGLMAPLGAGTLFVGLFFVVATLLGMTVEVARPAALFFALLGLLLASALTCIGTGAFLLSRLGSRPLDVAWKHDHDVAPIPAYPGAVVQPPSTGA